MMNLPPGFGKTAAFGVMALLKKHAMRGKISFDCIGERAKRANLLEDSSD